MSHSPSVDSSQTLNYTTNSTNVTGAILMNRSITKLVLTVNYNTLRYGTYQDGIILRIILLGAVGFINVEWFCSKYVYESKRSIQACCTLVSPW